MNKTYKERTKGFITASKMKDFKKCEMMFFLKWIAGNAEEKPATDAMNYGNILDDYVNMSEAEFWSKYVILEKNKKRKTEYEIKHSDGEKLLAHIAEIKRQKLFMNSTGYKAQEEIKCDYKGLALMGTLDRYSKELAIIRDTKSCQYHVNEYGKNFHQQAYQFGYPFSMAFYSILAEIRDGVKCKVYLDVFSKDNGLYRMYEIPDTILIPEKHHIIETLDKLATKKTEDDFECVDDMNVCLRCPMARFCKKTVQTEPDQIEEPEYNTI